MSNCRIDLETESRLLGEKVDEDALMVKPRWLRQKGARHDSGRGALNVHNEIEIRVRCFHQESLRFCQYPCE